LTWKDGGRGWTPRAFPPGSSQEGLPRTAKPPSWKAVVCVRTRDTVLALKGLLYITFKWSTIASWMSVSSLGMAKGSNRFKKKKGKCWNSINKKSYPDDVTSFDGSKWHQEWDRLLCQRLEQENLMGGIGPFQLQKFLAELRSIIKKFAPASNISSIQYKRGIHEVNCKVRPIWKWTLRGPEVSFPVLGEVWFSVG